MSIRRFLVLAGACAPLAMGCSDDGSGAPADSAALATPETTAAPSAPTTDPASVMTDGNVLAKLAAMDSMEVDLGRMALQKASNADVKAFGEMMVADHTTMLQEGQALAAEAGITPAPRVDDDTHRRHVDARERLGALAPTEFDRQYMQVMLEEHERAIGELQHLQANVQNQRLREHIEKAIPKVQAHRDRALELMERINAAG